jgi:4-hydroxybenzoate polyprenyltransferase
MNNSGKRWWVYQQERFPLSAHGPMVIVFCSALFSFSAEAGLSLDPGTLVLLLSAIALVLSLFFQLRIADEYKDAEIDRRYRSDRPVPRGLVSLQELACIGVALCFLQAGLALVIDWRLLALLGVTWGYIGLMTVEFFVPRWLTARPLAYLLSHMLVMPLITLLASAVFWIPAGSGMPPGFGWLLFGAFCLGVVLEVGRKIRAPADERTGVDTYSGAWGVPAAATAWILSGCLAAVAFAMASDFGHLVPLAIALSAVVFTTFAVLAGFNSSGGIVGKRVEAFSGVYVLALYVALGAAAFTNG